jgi:uncharacterized membrane protein YhaH (DUF805 family)
MASGVDAAVNAAIGHEFVGPVVSLAMLLPTLAVSVRRLHDSGLTGWWLLAPYAVSALGVVTCVAGLMTAVGPFFLGHADSGDVDAVLSIVLFAAGFGLLLGAVVLNIILMVRGSTWGPNKYGPSPTMPIPRAPASALPVYTPTPPPTDPGGDPR